MNGCIYRSQFDMCEKSKEEDEKRGIRRWCDFEGCEDKHPSNADIIRAMTDEELAKFLTKKMYARIAGDWKKWLDWLREAAE